MTDKARLNIIARYLDLIGIDHVAVPSAADSVDVACGSVAFDVLHKDKELVKLIDFIGDCRRCRLCEGRRNIVFGTGNPNAPVIFVGEGPGVEEDRRGEPFVGAAGKRLNVWIKKLGLEREEVYIANIVKCRPPGNRTPRPDEAATCLPFLERQIEIIAPKLIVTLGGPALNYLLGKNERITRVRGTPLVYGNIPLIPTYHPAYILRNPQKEKEVFLDLEGIREFLNPRI
ncbi:MAG: uracil-DNA glycosylase [Deltaproteobacteria bacterium]|nr:uracil-DNA glycosylase [Deltaproteobacteria bacterium]NIS76593.1 uracil-DNA glycosylase [Deltaproteobacteria bacterium]